MLSATVGLMDYYYQEALKCKQWLRKNPNADPDAIAEVKKGLGMAERKNRHFARTVAYEKERGY